jgi:hypothetical protein
MRTAVPTTISGMGRGIRRFKAAPMPPRLAAASMMLPTNASTTMGMSTHLGNWSRMQANRPLP